jgi:hypothetical protein
MKRLALYSILLLFILFSLACQSQLPKELPNDLEIRFESTVLYPDGEPRDSFRSIAIASDQMIVERSKCQRVEKVTLEDGDIKGLYRSFVQSEFDLIKNGSPPSGGNEEGFREIYLKTGNISKNVKHGKQFPLSEKDRIRFNAIWTTMLDLAVGKVSLRCTE